MSASKRVTWNIKHYKIGALFVIRLNANLLSAMVEISFNSQILQYYMFL